ncbi:5'-AMP-activated protein kinase subunit beta-1 [Pieris napi]|uniref:5'-AMP-activated protein kinase subunit beta-1 n=1 Tax=Pieris napi TaxID=78633 RepID=UPI001FBA50D4|nr:5'-AMP-activated protein kinase subunit beta-1 [Pieris napi]XP_047507635.1 5'-AMP-activated protein kinase subunit beta-1 [Pieris napi]XP_047507636.1 5'-AMP-activated protein kinase subunit beta-1 [Pieris napi]
MGNAGSNPPKEWTKDHQSKHVEVGPSSPTKDGEAFTFDKKTDDDRSGRDDDNILEEGAPYYTKAVPAYEDHDEEPMPRKRSNTLTESNKSIEDVQVLPTVFKWEGGGKQVFISGTFTEWKTIPMVKSHGDFVTIIDLPEGEHQYKYFVDGEWRHDPTVKVVDNGMGSKNNLVTVKMSDFEVFQALAKDSEGIHSSAQTEYSQEIPQSKPWEKVSGPPILPPHLLQVILNKDTPLSCEPTLLPEPNHVMLNHLYALSIKDGVMVLSATHRHRKKYVTTLLYKPI